MCKSNDFAGFTFGYIFIFQSGWFPKSYVKQSSVTLKSLNLEPVDLSGSRENLCSTPTTETAEGKTRYIQGLIQERKVY